MATKKRTNKAKRAVIKRFVTPAEIRQIRNKYYSLKRYLYALKESKKLNSVAQNYINSAYRRLEKWSRDTNYPRMSNFTAE